MAGKRLVPVTFKIDPEVLKALDTLAEAKKTSRSKIIRKAIELYLEMHGIRVKTGYRVVRLTT